MIGERGPAEAAPCASPGCGNPVELAELRPGEVVLDLGSGGGADAILAAHRVGPRGRVYGLDVAEAMLVLARENARRAGVRNAVFVRGRIERIPLADRSVDVVISNGVLNLSAERDRALREAFRVLRPGGRLAVCDLVVRGALPGEVEIPDGVRRSVETWAGCVAGAPTEVEYRDSLAAAGFESVEVREVARCRAEDLGEPFRRALAERGLQVPGNAAAIAGRFMSGFIRGARPARA